MEVRCFRASLLLSQHRDNLLFRKSLLLHSSVLNGPDSNQFWRKTSVAGQVPSCDSSNDLVWVCFPDEWFQFLIVLLDEAVDGGL